MSFLTQVAIFVEFEVSVTTEGSGISILKLEASEKIAFLRIGDCIVGEKA